MLARKLVARKLVAGSEWLVAGSEWLVAGSEWLVARKLVARVHLRWSG
jgi:hypothetical protein